MRFPAGHGKASVLGIIQVGTQWKTTGGRIGNISNSGSNSNTVNSNSNEGKPLFESLLCIPHLHAFF